MQNMVDDCHKPRLTDRVDIFTAVTILRARGYEREELTAEITRLFYVDLDEYNDVMRWMRSSERFEPARTAAT